MCKTTKAIERSPMLQRKLVLLRVELERLVKEFTRNGVKKGGEGGKGSRDAA